MFEAVDVEFSTSPYPGLRPFKEQESDIFFGRETQTDRLLERLQREHFLAVVGPSGCGKSSLVRAGMIAALETGFAVEAGSRWRVADLRPGDRPMRRLAQALVSPNALGPERANSADASAFVEAALRRGPLGLSEILRETPLPPQTNLLVLVDQFEEIFRFRERGDPDEADSFVALLLATCRQREAPVYVVITMRSDFLGDCALFPGLPEAINESQYLTPRLTRDQCRSAIVGPARVFGSDVESALVTRLLNDFGPDPDQLPLLQHALMRMWTRARERVTKEAPSPLPATVGTPESGVSAPAFVLTLRDYEELGGLTRALSDHADEVFGELSAEQQHIAETMFRRLAERGVGKRDTRAPARLRDVAAVAGVAVADVIAVAEIFRRPDRSFLTPPVGIALTEETLLDIGHETLIRQWHRLWTWVEEEARSAAMYQRLRQTAYLWKTGDAALWSNPDLERALHWQRREGPTQPWAGRYGSADDFALAMEFLGASEQAWREKVRQEREEEERRRLEEIDRQTRAEREHRLEAEARAGRRFKILAGILAAVLVFALLMAWAAVEQRRAAVEQGRRAEVAAAEESRQRQLAEERLTRITNGIRLKQAVLSGDTARISAALGSELANKTIRFDAERNYLGYKNPQGKPVFEFFLFPDEKSIPGGLGSIASITYRMDHPTFRNALLTTGPDRRFRASYIGWGCLTNVTVLIEYVEPDRSPEIAAFDMCDALVGAGI